MYLVLSYIYFLFAYSRFIWAFWKAMQTVEMIELVVVLCIYRICVRASEK
jgi:hypothetical protein